VFDARHYDTVVHAPPLVSDISSNYHSTNPMKLRVNTTLSQHIDKLPHDVLDASDYSPSSLRYPFPSSEPSQSTALRHSNASPLHMKMRNDMNISSLFRSNNEHLINGNQNQNGANLSYDEVMSITSTDSADKDSSGKRNKTSKYNSSKTSWRKLSLDGTSKMSDFNRKSPKRCSAELIQGDAGPATIAVHRTNKSRKIDAWLIDLGSSFSTSKILQSLKLSQDLEEKCQDFSDGTALCDIFMKAYRLSILPGVNWTPKTAAHRRQNIRKVLDGLKIRCKKLRLTDLAVEDDIFRGGLKGLLVIMEILDKLRQSTQVV